jgi:hypothetical protein
METEIVHMMLENSRVLGSWRLPQIFQQKAWEARQWTYRI